MKVAAMSLQTTLTNVVLASAVILLARNEQVTPLKLQRKLHERVLCRYFCKRSLLK